MRKTKRYSKKIFLIPVLTVVFAWSFFMKAGNAEAAINGVLRVPSGTGTNPRYFTDNSGKAIYLTGFQYWDVILENGTQDPTSPNYSQFLNTANQYGNNFIRLWIWNELSKFKYSSQSVYYSSYPIWLRTGPGAALDGKPKFDLTKFEQVYFDRLRSRVIQARDQGYYVSVMFFEGHSLYRSTTPWRWNGHPFNINNNINGIDGDKNKDGYGEIHSLQIPEALRIQEAYIRKVIDTVNDLDNVLYEISNEDQDISMDWQYYLIDFIHDYEKTKPKQHPVGMSTYYNSDNSGFINSALFSSNAEYVSPTKKYDGAVYDYFYNPPPADGNKVMFLDSDHINPQIGDRAWVWKSFARGNNPILYVELSDPTPQHISAQPATGHTLTYANKMNLAAMTPSASSSDCSTTYCLRNPGQEYLVYQPLSGAFTVNLSAGDYNYEWFNTVTGSTAGTGTVTASGGNKSFTPPFSGDAALYLVKEESDTAPPADVNNDNFVNIQDIQACVNVILGVETNTTIIQRARAVTAPLDGCNVLDLQAIVNEILAQ